MMRSVMMAVTGAVLAVGVLSTVPNLQAHDDPADEATRHYHAVVTIAPDYERTFVVVYKDIFYAEAPGDVDPYLMSLDVYTPEPDVTAGDPWPVMVWVRGGGGVRSDKEWGLEVKPKHYLANEGYIFVAINYRLGEQGQYPNAVQDVANAISWVHDNISRYGGDPNRIVVSAHSGGAPLVSRVATIDSFLAKSGKTREIIKGAITLDGGTFDGIGDDADTAEGRERLVSRYGPTRSDWENASPIHNVSADRYMPPFLMMHIGNGGRTEVDALAMADSLRSAGHSATVVDLIGKMHIEASQHLGEPGDPSTIALGRFLDSLPFATESSSVR